MSSCWPSTVLINMAHGSICRPDAGRPRKVVSGRTTTNLKRSVVSLEHSRNVSYECFFLPSLLSKIRQMKTCRSGSSSLPSSKPCERHKLYKYKWQYGSEKFEPLNIYTSEQNSQFCQRSGLCFWVGPTFLTSYLVFYYFIFVYVL